MNKSCNKTFSTILSIKIIIIFILLGALIYYKVTPKSFDTFQEAINTYTYEELDSIQYHYTINLQKSLVPVGIFEDYFYDLSNKYPHLLKIRYDAITNKARLYWIDNEKIRKRKEREMRNPRELEYRIKNIDTIRYKDYYFNGKCPH